MGAVNEDYEEMAGDFTRLGFLSAEADTEPVKETFVPALETIWKDSMGQSMADFNFRTVTSKFNKLVYKFPIRIPERYALVIRSLLTQEGICMTLSPDFHFLEVASPYVARRLLTDEDPQLRQRLTQVLFKDDRFQWQRLQNLLNLAKGGEGLDLSDTVKDGAVLIALDDDLREQVLNALSKATASTSRRCRRCCRRWRGASTRRRSSSRSPRLAGRSSSGGRTRYSPAEGGRTGPSPMNKIYGL